MSSNEKSWSGSSGMHGPSPARLNPPSTPEGTVRVVSLRQAPRSARSPNRLPHSPIGKAGLVSNGAYGNGTSADGNVRPASTLKMASEGGRNTPAVSKQHAVQRSSYPDNSDRLLSASSPPAKESTADRFRRVAQKGISNNLVDTTNNASEPERVKSARQLRPSVDSSAYTAKTTGVRVRASTAKPPGKDQLFYREKSLVGEKKVQKDSIAEKRGSKELSTEKKGLDEKRNSKDLSNNGRTSRTGLGMRRKSSVDPPGTARVKTGRTRLASTIERPSGSDLTMLGNNTPKLNVKTPSQPKLDPMAMLAAVKQPLNRSDSLKPEELAVMQHVLSGRLGSLPAQRSKVVRIFLSSTFTDMQLERDMLMTQVYPELKEILREKYGLEFQAFLGQRYGYRPIPSEIPEREFIMLSEIVRDIPEEYELLTKWYRCDANAKPPKYDLQPISTYLPNFTLKSNPEKQRENQNEWWAILQRLQQILRKGARGLNIAKGISNARLHDYLMSVTEREITHGILDAADRDAHTLAYFRHIKSIDPATMTNARFFVDLNSRNEIDEEAVKFLSQLKDVRTPKRLSVTNITRFEVETLSRDGIDVEQDPDYLQQFATTFRAQILEKVAEAVDKHERFAEDPLYEEALRHAAACNKHVATFRGREELLQKVQEYIQGPSAEPLLVYGQSGSGKTSIMAKTFSMVRDWIPCESKPVTILRFLGTSPDSSTIVPLLQSICSQVKANYPSNGNREKVPADISPLSVFFKKLLLCATAEKPLVIFLDSLDQLSATEGAHDLGWMPIELPPNVKLVLSCALLPNQPDIKIVDCFRNVTEGDENCVEVFQLGSLLGEMVIQSSLEQNMRYITDIQWEVVRAAFTRCNIPLFVKLVYDRVFKWKSYTPPMMTILPSTVHECIVDLLKEVEKRHGDILVSHAFRYLTTSKGGLSVAEIDDLLSLDDEVSDLTASKGGMRMAETDDFLSLNDEISYLAARKGDVSVSKIEDHLSLDDEVLNDVFQYHIPPIRRIPPLLWIRIHGDMADYFNEREANGISVVNWYHRQFTESVHRRYFRNIHLVRETHSNIADYFQGIWGGKPKPFEYTAEQIHRLNLHETSGEHDRRVSTQPMYYTDDNGKILRYNLRKLSELPFHLLKADRIDELHREVLFNFKWLHTKLSCFPLAAVIEDYEETILYRYDRDLRLIADALRLGTSVLARQPSMVGPQLIGRLLPYRRERPKIRQLLDQCDQEGMAVNALIPSYHCLHTPGGPLQLILGGHPRATFSMAITADQHHLVSISSILLVYDLSTGDISRKVNPGIRSVLRFLSVSPDDRFALSVTHNDQLFIANIFTGEFNLIKSPTDGAVIWGTAAARTHALVYTKDTIYFYEYDGTFSYKKSWDLENGCLVDIYISGKHKRHLMFRTDITDNGPEMTPDAMDTDVDPTSSKEGSNTFAETTGAMRIEEQGSSCEGFEFKGPYTLNNERTCMFVCNNSGKTEIPDNLTEENMWRFDPVKIEQYKKGLNGWIFEKVVAECDELLFCLIASADHKYVAATSVYGFKVWNTDTGTRVDLSLEEGVRNLPQQKRRTPLVIFTRDTRYLVTAVREKLYIWDIKTGAIAKTLNAHYKRILSMVYIPRHNRLITSSFDTTIKVWNLNDLLQRMHPLPRHSQPVERVHVATNAMYALATSRGDLGIWNLQNGRMFSLSLDTFSSMLTHGAISADGKVAVTSESGSVHVWNVDRRQKMFSEPQRGVLEILLVERDTRFLAFSREMQGPVQCVCRKVADCSINYTLTYPCKAFISPILTWDKLFLLVITKSEDNIDVLRGFHARTGTMLYDIPLTFGSYKNARRLILIPTEPSQIGLIDDTKVDIIDVKAKCWLRAIPDWNGVCTADGLYGLHAPPTGGLDLLDLTTKKVVRELLPRSNEGVFHSSTLFVSKDRLVLYYHGRKKSITLVRVSNGEVVAKYHLGVKVNSFQLSADENSLIVGSDDGSVTTLFILDPQDDNALQRLKNVPNRTSYDAAASSMVAADGSLRLSLRGAAKIAAIPSRIRKAKTTSRACTVS